MGKKILIINKSFELGGIQMAMINMIKALHNDYDITLAIFNPEGPLKDRVPDNVKLLKLSPLVEVLGMTGTDAKKRGSLFQLIFKIIASAWSKVFGNFLPISIALAFQKKLGYYDVVLSYHHESRSKTLVAGFGRFALKKVDSPLKISWIHSDILATGLATNYNLKVYKKFDKIVSVSKTTMDTVVTAYPELKDKCTYCYNYVLAEEVTNKAALQENVFDKKDGETILFSACRLVEVKGLIPALENLMPIFKQNSGLKWYIAGEGPLKNDIQKIINCNCIEDKVILLGYKDNPYPYMKEADFLFLPSIHETYSMVVNEAHILGTRVITSDISIMHEVTNSYDILCENNDYIRYMEKALEIKGDSFIPQKSNDYDWIRQFEEVIST